ncbi:hypothetical protein PCH_Pc22g02440 [Penicillium rubens Wisconsin 54-1255]|jgi:hypothetical protein|uniref:Uncharacterized protein n=1 Tax=Penicillium rubens (strain ATCC 28089 / DSM 1075 / NRRL 1951 / Wisconsin 54-1255) TaxID=500485 RepID=B6HPD5_PENRW|nr:hypothetical protein PCH_Pc22g02440 [Penicillium rubens Wisconsin 54-1255]
MVEGFAFPCLVKPSDLFSPPLRPIPCRRFMTSTIVEILYPLLAGRSNGIYRFLSTIVGGSGLQTFSSRAQQDLTSNLIYQLLPATTIRLLHNPTATYVSSTDFAPAHLVRIHRLPIKNGQYARACIYPFLFVTSCIWCLFFPLCFQHSISKSISRISRMFV